MEKKNMKNDISRDKNARVYLSRSRSGMIWNATNLRPAYNVQLIASKLKPAKRGMNLHVYEIQIISYV